jgi:predicted phage tail protein
MSNSRKTFVQRATQAIREARQLVIAFEALLRSMKGVVQTVLATVLLVAATWTQVQAKLAPIAGLFS